MDAESIELLIDTVGCEVIGPLTEDFRVWLRANLDKVFETISGGVDEVR